MIDFSEKGFKKCFETKFIFFHTTFIGFMKTH